MLPPRTQKGVPSPPALVCKMGTETISPSQSSGDCEEQVGTSVQLGEYGGWPLFNPKPQYRVCVWGEGHLHSPDETLHGEDVLGDTPRSQQCLQTHRNDQALCWVFAFHYLPWSQQRRSC